jgi:hypothetical protein
MDVQILNKTRLSGYRKNEKLTAKKNSDNCGDMGILLGEKDMNQEWMIMY